MTSLQAIQGPVDMLKGKLSEPGTKWGVKALQSIRAKFLIRFTILFAAIFIGIGFAIVNGLPFSSFDGWKGHARAEALTSLNLIADLEKERIIKWFMERQGDAQNLADNSLLQTNLARLLANIHDSVANDEDYKTLLLNSQNMVFYDQIHSLISNTKTAYAAHGGVNYQQIQVVDVKTGKVLVSTNDAEIGSPIDGHEKYLEQAISSGHYYISDVSTGVHGTEPHIDIAHTVIGPQDVPIGIVALGIALEDVFKQLLQTGHRLGASGEILLVNGESRILTPLQHALQDGTQARVMRHIITAKPARLAAAGKEGSIESQDYRGEAVIAAYRYLNLSPDWGWGLIVKIDKSQLYASINKGIDYSLWLGGLGIFLVITLNIILTGRLTGPLRQMTRVAGRMHSGDLAARVQINSNDEIGQLSAAFDSMADEIEHWHRDLEKRIVERTTMLNKEVRERKQAEEKYKQLAIQQSLVLDNAGEGIYGLDLNGHTTFANEAAVKLLGWSQDELLGRLQHDLIHHSRPDGSPYPREQCHIYASFKDGKTHSVSDEVFWRKNGTSFPVEYLSTPIRDDEELTGAVVIFRDITERKQAEKKIRQLNLSLEKKVTSRTAELAAVNQELESFAYSIAHDLRAPLRAIDGFSQALVEDYGERLDGEAKEFLGYLREGSQEMGLLIDDLLKLSRATRGEISRQDIDLSQLAADCIQALQQTDPERKVEVDIAAGIMVNADRRLMQVVLENLLENAWKFTARETAPKIEIGAEPVGKKVRCFIRDNGVGYDMAYQNKLFRPFARLHSTENFKGTGIGLSTVQRIINRHGGTIQAEGEVGQGACFTFELDAAKNDGHNEGLEADG